MEIEDSPEIDDVPVSGEKVPVVKSNESIPNPDDDGGDDDANQEEDNAWFTDEGLQKYMNALDRVLPELAVVFDHTRPDYNRLIIHQIVCTNFKSYYGNKIIGPFDENFSSIIGPNGSGKSNVIDSLLFVFAFNPKDIRTKKLSELIHKSARHKDVTSASVQVDFKRVCGEKGSFKEIEGKSFSVKRTVTHDNKSKLFLNGKVLDATTLINTLIKEGIDLRHNRFLILQGEVEKISLLKPKSNKEGDDGMLEFMDDIIGTRRYHDVIADLDLCINELQVKLTNKRARYNSIEVEKKKLEDTVGSILTYLRTYNAIQSHNFQLGTIGLTREKEFLRLAKARLEGIEEVMSAMKAEIQDLKSKDKEIDSKKKTLNEVYVLSDRRTCSLVSRISCKSLNKEKQNQRNFEILKNENGSKLDELNAKKDKAETDRQANENKANELIEEIDSLSHAPILIKKQGVELNKELAKMEDDEMTYKNDYSVAVDRFDVKAVSLKENVSHHSVSYNNIKKEEDGAIANYNKVSIDLDALSYDQNKEKEMLSAIEEEIIAIENTTKSRASRLNNLKADKDRKESEMPDIHQKIQDLRERKDPLLRKNEKISLECSNLAEKLKELNENSGLGAASKIHKFLASYTDRGFYGRVGDLGSINPKYDIAISTLGGGGLDMYVVDTIANCQFLLDELRKNNAGRGRFYVLEKLKDNPDYYKEVDYKTPKILRAFDLIKNVDPKFRCVFYNIFNESVIIPHLDDLKATKEHFNRNTPKIITLRGDVVESTGRMIGGGRPSQGKMGTKKVIAVSAQDKANLEKDLRNAEKQRDENKVTLNDVELSYITYVKRRNDYESLILKINETVASESNQLSHENETLSHKKIRRHQIVETIKNIVVDKDKVDFYTLKLEQIKDERNGIEERLKIAHLAKKEAQQKLDDLYESDVKPSKELVDRIHETINQTKQLIVKNNKDFTHSKKNLEKKSSESTETDENIKRLKKLITKLEVTVHVTEEEQANLGNKLSQSEDIIKELKLQIDKLGADSPNYQKTLELEREYAEQEEVKTNSAHEIHEHRTRYTTYKKIAKDSYFLVSKLMHKIPEEIRYFKNTEPYYSKTLFDMEEKLIGKLIENEEEVRDEYATEGASYKVIPEPFEKEFILKELTSKEEILKQKRIDLKDNFDGMTSPHFDIIKEFIARNQRFINEKRQLGKISRLFTKIRHRSENAKRDRHNEFHRGFSCIAAHVKRVYQKITFGGDADMDAVDKFNPYSEGINFQVRPPGKAWKKMTDLSGGEKTLASLSLVFALHEYRPTPLYVMDEIDAALDFRNVSIIAEYIRQRTANAQFIVVSLRQQMYEKSDISICIYKIQDITQVVAITASLLSQDLGNNSNRLFESTETAESNRRRLINPPNSQIIAFLESQ
uniref:Structural maintenance of chromosomes protein n=1 Tax=Rhabditophanes sp. KR3021 TaxID=114890 RepID=A0AC35TFT4_9BILA